MQNDINVLIERSVISSPPVLLFEIINCLDSELNNESIGRVIGRDQGVSAQVLKLSNSSFFGYSGEIKSLGQALNVLGTKAVRNIAVSSLLFSHTHRIKLWNLDIMDFWLHSFLVAELSRGIAKLTGLDSDEAYITGLLHDIGKLVLYSHKHGDLQLFKEKHSGKDIFSLEKRVWSLSSVEVGERLLRKWKLPVEIVEAISGLEDGKRKTYFAIVVYLANEFASVVTDELYVSTLSRDRLVKMLGALGVEYNSFLRFADGIPDTVERGRAIMSILSKESREHERSVLNVSLVTSERYSLSRVLLILAGCKVDVVMTKESRKSHVSEVDTGQERERGGVFSCFKRILHLGNDNGDRVMEREAGKTIGSRDKELKNHKWGDIVVFENCPERVFEREGMQTFLVRDDDRDDGLGLPFFFSRINLIV